MKTSVPHRFFASKLLPTDGWEHSEQPVTDSPLMGKLTYWKELVKKNYMKKLHEKLKDFDYD